MDLTKNASTENETIGLVWEREIIPYSEIYGDHFYSHNNGREECRHVFIEGNNLPTRLASKNVFTIAELGFGTGLNFLETWHFWRSIRKENHKLNFVSFERHPLDAAEILRALTQWPELEPLSKSLAEYWSSKAGKQYFWHLDPQTTLLVYFMDANAGLSQWQNKADAWYLDGFSPAKNPEMWSKELMKNVFEHTCNNGTFATYTSAGWVRRNLSDAGFDVSRVPGHGNKRHMITGVKYDL
jgi:tRNA U34 5-methylaminomethyl-2-thiouridine-forming methyltransferase MnmC